MSGAISPYNPYTGITVGQRTGLAPGYSVILHVDLKPGQCAWGCHVRGEATHQDDWYGRSLLATLLTRGESLERA
jgi:hypothetical protein